MKKLLLIPLLFLLSGCYTVLSPSVGIRSNVRPGLEVHYDWYGAYPIVFYKPYFYYPRSNRVIYVNYYEFNNFYIYRTNRRNYGTGYASVYTPPKRGATGRVESREATRTPRSAVKGETSRKTRSVKRTETPTTTRSSRTRSSDRSKTTTTPRRTTRKRSN